VVLTLNIGYLVNAAMRLVRNQNSENASRTKIVGKLKQCGGENQAIEIDRRRRSGETSVNYATPRRANVRKRAPKLAPEYRRED
jgi:hypothetical protein